MENLDTSFEVNLQRLKQELLPRLEEIVTDPIDNRGISLDIYEDIKSGRKVVGSIALEALVNVIGQDLRVDPNQLAVIKKEIFLD